MEKITAYGMALKVADENRPYDKAWLRSIKRSYSKDELHAWAVANIEPFVGTYCPKTASKQFIGRAANELIGIVFSEI